jgi:hypothetical protein
MASRRRRIDAERFMSGSEVSRGRGEWVDPALDRISLSEWANIRLQAVISVSLPAANAAKLTCDNTPQNPHWWGVRHNSSQHG